MALVKCKECGEEVSSKAEKCPKCGVQIARKPIGCGGAMAIFILLGVIGASMSSIMGSGGGETSSTAAVAEESKSPPAEKVPGEQWHYEQSDDKMSKGSIYHAIVMSTNSVDFDFPYSGRQYAALELRTHPRFGKDIIFRIEKGQVLCSSYDGCTVLVRFDDQTAVKYSANTAADHSTEVLFINNYSRFVQNMLKAKTVRIAAEIYQQGSPVFEFDVSHFDQNKYRPKN